MNLLLAGAMLMTFSGSMAEAQQRPPIYLESEQVGSGIRLRVVGRADTAMDATYTLTVSSGGAGSNRSVQSGRARLQPDREATLIDLRLGGAGDSDWSAKLEVQPADAASYTQQLGPAG